MAIVIGFANAGGAIVGPGAQRFFKKLPRALAAFADNAVDWQVRRIRNDLKRFEQ